MTDIVKQTYMLEKTGVFNEEQNRRYELSLVYKGLTGKRAMIVGINPASDNVQVFDTTTNYLLNNLGTMGFSEIVVWNLFSEICDKLRPNEQEEDEYNFEHLQKILETEFDAIIIGYGSTFLGNKNVESAKTRLHDMLKPYKDKVFEITDNVGVYSDLKTIHPLFAGQRFSGKWKLIKHEFPEEERKDKK